MIKLILCYATMIASWIILIYSIVKRIIDKVASRKAKKERKDIRKR